MRINARFAIPFSQQYWLRSEKKKASVLRKALMGATTREGRGRCGGGKGGKEEVKCEMRRTDRRPQGRILQVCPHSRNLYTRDLRVERRGEA